MISSLLVYADKYHGDAEIVSRTIEGPVHRYSYRDAHARARRLARALGRLGVKAGGRGAFRNRGGVAAIPRTWFNEGGTAGAGRTRRRVHPNGTSAATLWRGLCA